MLNPAAKLAIQSAEKGTKLVEGGIKKFWSVMDAASQKAAPHTELSPKAQKAIRGLSD